VDDGDEDDDDDEGQAGGPPAAEEPGTAAMIEGDFDDEDDEDFDEGVRATAAYMCCTTCASVQYVQCRFAMRCHVVE
jgi:hypothetical protein